MNDASVSVHGEATVETEPDEARVGILVTVLAKTLDAALDEAARRTQGLIEVFRELDLADASWRTETVSVEDEQEYTEHGRVHRGYRASSRTMVHLDDPSMAGRLMKEATVRSEARIDGPRWIVSQDNPARLEACREAVRDGRGKAEAYADALGLRLGALLKASEPDLTAPGSLHMVIGKVARSASAGPEMPMEQGLVPVSAAIDLTYALAEAPAPVAGEVQRA